MEAARRMAERGHRVLLVERRRELGGQLRLAAKAPLFQNVETSAPVVLTFVEFLARQLERAGVEVRLGAAVTPGLIDELKPETVVLATGASYRVPFHWLVPRLLDSRWGRSRAAKALGRLLFSVMRKRNDGLDRHVRRSGVPVQRIGDCNQPRKTVDAMLEAAELADRL